MGVGGMGMGSRRVGLFVCFWVGLLLGGRDGGVLAWEFCLWGFTWAGWEFVWRGFMGLGGRNG